MSGSCLLDAYVSLAHNVAKRLLAAQEGFTELLGGAGVGQEAAFQ